MGTNVFFSYAAPDQHLARLVGARLAEQGITLAHVEPGDDFSDSMIPTLQGSDAAVLFISGEATDSAALMSELGAVTALHKRIVVVLPDESPLPISFASHVGVVQAGQMTPEQIAAAVRDRLAA